MNTQFPKLVLSLCYKTKQKDLLIFAKYLFLNQRKTDKKSMLL